MGMILKAGARFKSDVCDTAVMVIKAPAGEYDLRCGGATMIPPTETPGSSTIQSSFASESLIGKRYVNADESVELLCTKGGKGTLSLNGAAMEVKQAKQLPSSD